MGGGNFVLNPRGVLAAARSPDFAKIAATAVQLTVSFISPSTLGTTKEERNPPDTPGLTPRCEEIKSLFEIRHLTFVIFHAAAGSTSHHDERFEK